MPKLTAGSWVYGTLSTWIGIRRSTCAWEMLCDVKQAAHRALDSGRPTPPQKPSLASVDLRKLRLVLVVRRLQLAAVGLR